MKRFGADPISWSTLQPGLSYLDTSFGFIAWHRAFGVTLSLGPPVCADEDRQELLERFFRSTRGATLFYVRDDVATLAQQLGGRRLHRCGLGVDKVLSLEQGLTPSPQVRGALKQAAKAKLTLTPLQHGEARARLDEITAPYLQKSAVPAQMHFLNRPLDHHDDEAARLFALRLGTESSFFGYAVLDPYFAHGKVHGYLLNLLRFESTKLWGVYFAVVAQLAELLRAENVRELSLGFSPLSKLSTDGAPPELARQLLWLQRRFSNAGYFARLEALKAELAGEPVQRYLVTGARVLAPHLLTFLHAGRLPLGLLARRFVKLLLER